MFGSIALDIVIGLVFVYLLYSLLATILAEFIVSSLGIRARMLRQAIERMLNDRYWEDTTCKRYQKFLHSLAIFLLYEFKEFKTSVAGRFYQEPSVKYLSKGKTGFLGIFNSTKPSYLRPANFTETLIRMLKDKGVGDTEMQKIAFSLKFNSIGVQPNSLKQITNLFTDSGGDPDKFREKLNTWYNEMMERLSGWFKRKIQLVLFLVGLMMAIAFNVDSISIAKKLSKDKNAREQMVQMAISASDSNSSISKALKQSNDTILNDSLLKESYSQVKQATDDAGMVLGLGWNLEKLTRSYTIEIPNSRLVTCWNYASVKPLCGKLPKSWSTDSLRMVKLNQCLKDHKDSLKKFTAILNYFGNTDFIKIDRIIVKNQQRSFVEGRRNFSAREKAAYILQHTICNWLVLLGFIITALAVSLGSNFWFDLLNKLVSMRSAGVKPAEKAADATEPDPLATPGGIVAARAQVPVQPQLPDPPDDLICSMVLRYSEELMNTPGVRSVFKGLLSPDGLPTPCIRVNVADELTKNLVESKIGEIPGLLTEIPVSIVVSGKPQTHQGKHNGQISNMSKMNGTGSIGCVVQHQGTKLKHILSCWHVLKGDLNYDSDDPHTAIMDFNDVKIATRWAGGIEQSYDFGFARCLPEKPCDNAFFPEEMKLKQFNFRQVTDKDINRQIEIKYYDSINNLVRTGKIYAWSPSVIITYPDKPRYMKDILVLTDDSTGQERTISQSGNSGSLIFDENGSALGMIIAGDDMYSYAVKLSNILNLFPEMKII